MKVQEVLEKTTQFFKQKGYSTARLDTELLMAHALGWQRMDLYLKFDYPLSDKELNDCRELVRRRGKGEPVAYIKGTRGFYKNDFFVSEKVLIPRPETELLVENALEWASKTNDSIDRVLDLGVGSGCLGLSIASELKNTRLYAVDISAEALDIAKKNSDHLSISERVKFIHKSANEISLNDLSNQPIDLLLANPPYIPIDDSEVESGVREYEPSIALFSGEDGLDCIKTWTKVGMTVLRSGGLLLMEIGWNQGPKVLNIMEGQKAWDQIEILKDYAGKDRILRAFRKNIN